jgi:hypothetical protein
MSDHRIPSEDGEELRVNLARLPSGRPAVHISEWRGASCRRGVRLYRDQIAGVIKALQALQSEAV